MLKYDQLIIGTGGPWVGPLAIPGLAAGSFLQKQEVLAGMNRRDLAENIALTGGDPLRPSYRCVANRTVLIGRIEVGLVRMARHFLGLSSFCFSS